MPIPRHDLPVQPSGLPRTPITEVDRLAAVSLVMEENDQLPPDLRRPDKDVYVYAEKVMSGQLDDSPRVRLMAAYREAAFSLGERAARDPEVVRRNPGFDSSIPPAELVSDSLKENMSAILEHNLPLRLRMMPSVSFHSTDIYFDSLETLAKCLEVTFQNHPNGIPRISGNIVHWGEKPSRSSSIAIIRKDIVPLPQIIREPKILVEHKVGSDHMIRWDPARPEVAEVSPYAKINPTPDNTPRYPSGEPISEARKETKRHPLHDL